MLRTVHFEEAAKNFRSFYNSLQHLSANINGVNSVFHGEYIKPSGSIKFTAVVFGTSDKTPELKDRKIALVVESEMPDWVIRSQVYEKQRDAIDRAKNRLVIKIPNWKSQIPLATGWNLGFDIWNVPH